METTLTAKVSYHGGIQMLKVTFEPGTDALKDIATTHEDIWAIFSRTQRGHLIEVQLLAPFLGRNPAYAKAAKELLGPVLWEFGSVLYRTSSFAWVSVEFWGTELETLQARWNKIHDKVRKDIGRPILTS